MRHELSAVTIDGQDDVPWTKVALGGFAAWGYLQVAFIHTHTENPYTSTGGRKKKKERVVITGVKLPVRKEGKKEGKKGIRLRVSPQRPTSTKAAVSRLMQHCFWADDTVYIFKSPQRELEVRGQEELCKGRKMFEANQKVFNGIIIRLISNCMIRFWQMVGAGFCNGAMTLSYHLYTFFGCFYFFLIFFGRLPYYRDYPLQDGAGSALQSLTPEAHSSADI